MNNNFHIGSIIREKVRERRIRVNDFAKAIHCSRPNVYSIFRRKSINIDLLRLISKALNYDFTEIYNKSLEMPKELESCVIVLETSRKKLDELQADTAVCIVRSWMLSEM
ncbi:MAG: helix-turn-helix domain-containing protein [Bacteroidales bacterium]|jgi:transcriptional regulator with XRE-family HTH domain|nr:helix-turn-helix domain-containing protein [Bacteroidales bacterium]